MNRSTSFRQHRQSISKNKIFLSMPITSSRPCQLFDCQIDRCLKSPDALKNNIINNPFFKAQIQAKMQNQAERQKDLYGEMNAGEYLEEYYTQNQNFNGLNMETSSLSYNLMQKQRRQRKKSQEIKKVLRNFQNFV